jgi:hypothetical protein
LQHHYAIAGHGNIIFCGKCAHPTLFINLFIMYFILNVYRLSIYQEYYTYTAEYIYNSNVILICSNSSFIHPNSKQSEEWMTIIQKHVTTYLFLVDVFSLCSTAVFNITSLSSVSTLIKYLFKWRPGLLNELGSWIT